MSLVNKNWIGLHGEPVTGRIPPRMLVMNGVQPNPQQMGMIAHHYKLLTYMMKVSVIPFLIQERTLTDGTRIRMVSSYGTDTVMVWPTGGSDSFSMGTLFVVRAVRIQPGNTLPDGQGALGWFMGNAVRDAQQVGTEYDNTFPEKPKLVNGAVVLKIRAGEDKKKRPVIVHRGGVIGLGMTGNWWESQIHYGTGVTIIGGYVFVGPHLCADISGWDEIMEGTERIIAVSRRGRSTLHVATNVGVLKWKLPTNPDGTLPSIRDKDYIKLKEAGKPLPRAEMNADYIIRFKEVEPDTIWVGQAQFGVDGGSIAWESEQRTLPGAFETVNLISGVITNDPNDEEKYILSKKTVTSLSRDISESSSHSPISLPKKNIYGFDYYVVGTRTSVINYTSPRYYTTYVGGHAEAPSTLETYSNLATVRAEGEADAQVGYVGGQGAPASASPAFPKRASRIDDDWSVLLTPTYSESSSGSRYETARWAAVKGSGQVISGSVTSIRSSSSMATENIKFAGSAIENTGPEGLDRIASGEYTVDAVWGPAISTNASANILGIQLGNSTTFSVRYENEKAPVLVEEFTRKSEFVGFSAGESEVSNTYWTSYDAATDTFTNHPETFTLSTEQVRARETVEVTLAIGRLQAATLPWLKSQETTGANCEYLCYLNLDTGWAITQRLEHSGYVSTDQSVFPAQESVSNTGVIVTSAKKLREGGVSTYEVHRATLPTLMDGGNGYGVPVLHDRLFPQHQAGGAHAGKLGFLPAVVSSNECVMLSFGNGVVKDGNSGGYGFVQGGSPRAAAFAVCDDGTVTDLYDVIDVPGATEAPETAFEMTLLREKI